MSINPQLYPSIPPVQDTIPRPFWTVLIPAYKPQYLAQALRSVLDQDPGPEQMEIVVIDDCSPNALEPIVRQAAGDRVTYIRQEKNLGTYATQNQGILMSRGIWIHVLNDDDWVLPGFYGAFRASLQNQPASVGAACCLYANTDSQGHPIFMPDLLRMTPGILENFILTMGVKNPVNPVAVVVRRSVHERLGGYFPGLKYTADWEFYKRVAIHYDWWYEPRVMACYREHSQNCSFDAVMSADQIREMGRAIEMTEPHLPPDLRAKITAASRDFYAAYAINRAEVLFRAGDVPAAMRQLQAGLQLSSSPQILDGLLVLLGRPAALPLRQLLPQFVQMVR